MPAIVLALGPKPRANLGDIVRTGAVDLVEYPTSKRQLAAALKRAFDIADVVGRRRGPDAPRRRARLAVDRPQFAEVFTVASSSGGCGKTFYATNLACYLAAQTGKRVCLVDLDLQFGEVSTALHLRPTFTISRPAVREDRSTTTTSTSTSRNTSKSMSSGSRSWPRPSARRMPT